MLGDDDGEAYSGSQVDLEGAAEDLFSCPPRPQPLRFETLSLKTPKTVPPTQGTALQKKIESRPEKSLGTQFKIQLQQQMGVFQGSMLEAMQSLRDEFQTMKKVSEVGVDQTSALAAKPGTSKKTDNLPPNQNPNTQQLNTQPSEHMDEPMEMDFLVPLFHHHLDRVLSPSMTQIRTESPV